MTKKIKDVPIGDPPDTEIQPSVEQNADQVKPDSVEQNAEKDLPTGETPDTEIQPSVEQSSDQVKPVDEQYDQLKAKAGIVFSTHSANVLYFTGDGSCFIEYPHAADHATNINNVEIVTIKREEV